MTTSLCWLSLTVVLQAAAATQPTPPTAPPRPRILFDLGHGQTYFSAEPGKDTVVQKAYAAMLEPIGIDLSVTREPLSAATVAGHQTLVVLGPIEPIEPAEEKAIVDFVNGGGSLLLIVDEERRASLARTRVNEIARPFGMTLTADTPYLHNRGARARAGRINAAARDLPYSGGRAVEGGTPFSALLDADGQPTPLAHAAWTETASGGRVIVMGEAMAAILLGQPEGVRLGGGLRPGDTIYWGTDSRMFMIEVMSWLTHRIR